MAVLRSASACVVLYAVLGASAARADDHADQASGATPLAVTGAPVAGVTEVGGDRDWFRFPVDAGAKYVVRTSRLGAGSDTLIGLWGPSGAQLAVNDDFGGTLASRIEFTAPATGTCWLLVVQYDQTNGRGSYAVDAARVTATPAPTPTPAPPAPVTPATPAPPVPATSAGVISAAPVFDPKLAGASLDVRTRLAGSGAYAATVRVVDAAGRSVRALASTAQRQAGADYSDAWDGRDAAGLFVAPGRYRLRLEAQRPGQAAGLVERALVIARLGIVSIAFEGASRVSMDFHRTNPSVAGSRYPVDAAGPAWAAERSSLGDGCLDRADGTPVVLPAPWTTVSAPPRTSTGGVATRGRSLPVAYALGARPTLRVKLGDAAAHGGAAVACGYPVSGTPIRLVLGGEATTELSPGAEVTLRAPALPGAIGRSDLEHALRFEAWDGQAWAQVPGGVRASVRAYTVLGPPASGVARPWVAAVDRVAGWSAGRAQDVHGALEAITRAVNEVEGLRYDVVGGAPAYTDGWDLSSPELDLDAWLARSNGSVVNCLDCAGAVTALAAQVGAEAQVATLGDNFALHWIRGIGGSRFIHDLFGGWHAFSYHAVATVDLAASIHDACLRVDDDATPSAAPFTERLPVAMPFARYREKLSSDLVRVTGVGHSSVR